MPSYVFVGRVIPERANVNVSTLQLHIAAPDAGFEAATILTISLSIIVAKVDTPTPITDFLTFKNYLEHQVGLVVAALGFATGCGYAVEITSEVTQVPHIIFGVGIPEIGSASTEAAQTTVNRIIQVMTPDKSLATFHMVQALHDYREAIRMPHATAASCYRAIEALSHLFWDDRLEEPKAKKAAWVKLRENLNVEESYLKWLTGLATQQRHGHAVAMTGADRVRALRITKEMISRYVEYLYREERLDLKLFPTLSGDVMGQ